MKIETTVVGLPYYNYSKYKDSIREYIYLTLEHDINNTYSKTAVSVFYPANNGDLYQIGYITGRDSARILRHIKNNRLSKVYVTSIGQKVLHVVADVPDEEKVLYDKEYEANCLIEYTLIKKIQEQMDKEGTNMFDKLIKTNKDVAANAAFLEAGRIANNQIVKVAASKAPLMVKGYVDTPIGKLIVANLAAAAIAQYKPADVKLAKLTNAMLQDAYLDAVRTLNIEGMINEFLDNADVAKAVNALAVEEKSA